MRVAYLINQYPKVSHTFIRTEMLALQKIGIDVRRYAIRGWDAPVPDVLDEQEMKLTSYALRDGPLPLLTAILFCFSTLPIATARALFLSLSMARKSHRKFFYHLIYFAEACWLAVRLKRESIEHVHAHFGTNPAQIAMLASVITGTPYSFTIHGPEEFDSPEALGLREKIDRAKFVVAVSSFGRSQVYRWTKFEDWRKVNIVHCSLADSFLQESIDARNAQNTLVCVGRLCPEKGQLLLVRAISKYKALYGNPPNVVLIGDGELRTAIEHEIRVKGLVDVISITGWVSSSVVGQHLRNCRAMVLPSFAEGLPVGIMESMALSAPVIATIIAGIPELVRNGVDGWLIPSGSIDELVSAIKKCLDSSEGILARMGTAARSQVLLRHDSAHQALKLATLLREGNGS